MNYGYVTDEIEYNSRFDFDIWKTDYISSTFIAASTLNKSWGKLSSLWEIGPSNSLNKWKGCCIDGIKAINASQISSF